MPNANGDLSHYEILEQREKQMLNRIDTWERVIEDKQREIRNYDHFIKCEQADLLILQNEMRQVEMMADEEERNGGGFVGIKTVSSYAADDSYWIVQDRDGHYSWGYFYRGSFQLCPREFLTQGDAEKDCERRDLAVLRGESVMF